MTFSVHLDDRTVASLKKAAARQNRSKNAIVAEAVKRWLAETANSEWPADLLKWAGDPKLPPFESRRPRGRAKSRFP